MKYSYKKIVCYTCCTGEYDDILQHDIINPNYDYVFFTDNKELIKKKQVGHWRIRPLVYKKSTNVKNARWHKVNAHILFPEYEYSLWCDANIIIKKDDVYNKIEEFISKGVQFSVPLHPERICIYEEGQIIKELKIDTEKTVDKELKFLIKQKYPINNGLHETCILFRKHNEIKNVLTSWWKMIYKYSKRDQLSFDYVMWKENICVYPFYTNGKEHRQNGDFAFIYGKKHDQDKIKRINYKHKIKSLFASLFYKKKENTKKYRFWGMPLFSIKNKNNRRIIRFLGIKIKIKKYIQREYIKNIEQQIIDIKQEHKKDYNYYKNLHPSMYAEELKLWFKMVTGCELNLENPKTFNEKIQWLKLYDSTPLKTRLADKYLVRDWVKEKIGEQYLIPLLGVYDKFEDIDFNKLPNQFVIKCNHGSGYNIIVKDKLQFNIDEARQKIKSWMNEDFAFKCGFEMHYSNISRKIIIEQYIKPEISNIEIQSWCFHNVLKFISYETCKDAATPLRAIFTPDWEPENFMVSPQHYSKFLELPSKPKYLDELKEVVSILCKGFKHVRVDFIVIEDKLYFREMTFTSGSGLSIFEPSCITYELGDMIYIGKSDIKRN